MSMNSFRMGMLSGVVVGMAAGMLVVPEMDRSTKRKLRKSYKQMRHFAGDTYDNVAGWIRK